MPLLEGLKVVKSQIHGYGLVATRGFRAGDQLCFGDGVLYRDHQEFDDTYCLVMPAYESPNEEGPPLYFDLVDQTRWINHSCAPNTEVEARWDDGSLTVWWVATRDIEVGEELTYDYAFSAEVAEPCACGATGCRGLIIDLDELASVPEKLRPLLRVA